MLDGASAQDQVVLLTRKAGQRCADSPLYTICYAHIFSINDEGSRVCTNRFHPSGRNTGNNAERDGHAKIGAIGRSHRADESDENDRERGDLPL